MKLPGFTAEASLNPTINNRYLMQTSFAKRIKPNVIPAYNCDAVQCVCVGDADCTQMFSSGVCGQIASCDTTNPYMPVCRCYRQPL